MVVKKTIAIIKNSTRRKKILKKAIIRRKLNAITILVKLRSDNGLFLYLCLSYVFNRLVFKGPIFLITVI